MTPDTRESIETKLIAAFREEIPDDGFTARVAAALPPAAAPRDRTLPLVALAALAGCAVATFLVPVGPSLLEGLRDLAASRALTPAAIGALTALAALTATGAVVAADS